MQEGKDTVKDGNNHNGEDLVTPVLPSIKMLAGLSLPHSLYPE